MPPAGPRKGCGPTAPDPSGSGKKGDDLQAAGTTIAITGGGNGIGRELALQLLGKGAAMMDRLSRLMPERAAALIYRQMKSLLAN